MSVDRSEAVNLARNIMDGPEDRRGMAPHQQIKAQVRQPGQQGLPAAQEACPAIGA